MAGKPTKRALRFYYTLPLLILLFPACARHHVAIDRFPSTKGVYHVVERHQTLYRICKTYGVDLKTVALRNGIQDHHKIRMGQRIFIPGAERPLKVDIHIEDVVLEPSESEKLTPQRFDFGWPVEGKKTNLFENSERKMHQGIDISAPLGTPIKAAGPGVVIYAGNTIKGYGNLIILRHSQEIVTVYAHNQVNLVEEGAPVDRGQVIGKVGQTGRATGCHLHFEIRRNNKAVDPLLYLK